VVRAVTEQKEKKEQKTTPEGKEDRVIEELKKSGMTAAKAKQLLKTWGEVGVKDPEQLRKLLVNKSLAPVPGIAIQAVLDTVACLGGFYVADIAGKSEIPFRIGVEILGNFMGIYYFIQALLQMSIVGGLVYTSYKYGTNSGELLAAVTKMAGPASGVGLVDQAARVVNVLKVMSALENVAAILREQYGETPKDNSLRNLGAYLTLAQAREKYNFMPEQYGLTDREAGNIAYAFSEIDTNQNFRLEPNELSRLCTSLGRELDDDEVKEAVKILDKDGNGWIDFTEFVQWWVSRPAKK